MKTGLILEGGAMRGMFSCGILDVLMENGVTFDGCAGISAGAVFGCNFKSGQIGRPIRYNKKYCADPRYMSLRSLVTTGDLYGVQFCYHELPDKLDVFDRKAFSENSMAFYVGATDVDTGKAVYHLCKDGGAEDIEWMRASASMPMVSRVVEIGDYRLLDGGIVEPVPYDFMRREGYGRNVVILTQPREYRKKKSAMLPLMRLTMRAYPKVVEAMALRHERYNAMTDRIAEDEQQGKVLVLRPPEALDISRTEKDPEELERVYQMGRRIALQRLDEVRAYLS